MDRQGISPSVYNINDEFDATNNNSDAKMDKRMEEIKALIKNRKRSSSSSRRRSRAHGVMVLSLTVSIGGTNEEARS